MRDYFSTIGKLGLLVATLGYSAAIARAEFQAGAAEVDITPQQLPVIMNGSFLERQVDEVSDPLRVRCLVLQDDSEPLCIAVVDSCMIPRDLCDRIKTLAAEESGIPTHRMLVAATHTHSAPSLMNYCLAGRRDDTYTEFAIPKIAECIVQASSRLQPAEAGWAVTSAPKHTHCRRWIRRPDRVDVDPFGQRTVRAMMHPGYQNPDYLGPAGPVDAGLSLLSIRSTTGEPICLLTNYSMHYVGGVRGVSADYWGHFARQMRRRILEKDPEKDSNEGETPQAPPAGFVAMMSQGTSGDLHWMDYSEAKQPTTPQRYASELADITYAALQDIEYRTDVTLAMAQSKLTLGRRLPNDERLRWAREVNEARGSRPPQDRPEVYANQAEWLHENPAEELLLQAIRVGELGITAIPNEVFGITGLKIKAQSPLAVTFNMELANGAAGYIPPPEQHKLGGYTTWPARTAGLETDAEPKIVARVLELLEQVSGQKRKPLQRDLYPPSIRANMRIALPATE